MSGLICAVYIFRCAKKVQHLRKKVHIKTGMPPDVARHLGLKEVEASHPTGGKETKILFMLVFEGRAACSLD